MEMNKEDIQKQLESLISNIPRNGYKDNTQKCWISLDENQVYEAVKKAFNLGLEVAADNAIADYNTVYSGIGEDVEVYVIKNSILEHKLV